MEIVNTGSNTTKGSLKTSEASFSEAKTHYLVFRLPIWLCRLFFV